MQNLTRGNYRSGIKAWTLEFVIYPDGRVRKVTGHQVPRVLKSQRRSKPNWDILKIEQTSEFFAATLHQATVASSQRLANGNFNLVQLNLQTTMSHLAKLKRKSVSRLLANCPD